MDKQTLAEKSVQKMIGNDPFSRWLGIRVKEIKPGSVTLEMSVRPEMLNGFGVAHGGIAYSLADSALAFAANTHGKVSLALENNISYIKKITEKDLLTAKTEELSVGRTIGVYQITITRNDEEKVAVFRGTVYRTENDHFPEETKKKEA
ncbi:hotdog fold thioesterase [Aliifodinibius sp. S!AR15-10]|uniref:PaaI family thioesterase n=1 Tax=Aliifodinibius sp. S!AR15-10 TaxID=2950437 RepID=UPI00285ECC77|nr:hotdog fold thioesterase [Aliifodinibius sp. S!AR15-10]MDR8393308.1 hotdog fold thioesterase [Aliifodinibius sp. S!AR15-10]